jgi:hypothetical protein
MEVMDGRAGRLGVGKRKASEGVGERLLMNGGDGGLDWAVGEGC